MKRNSYWTWETFTEPTSNCEHENIKLNVIGNTCRKVENPKARLRILKKLLEREHYKEEKSNLSFEELNVVFQYDASYCICSWKSCINSSFHIIFW